MIPHDTSPATRDQPFECSRKKPSSTCQLSHFSKILRKSAVRSRVCVSSGRVTPEASGPGGRPTRRSRERFRSFCPQQVFGVQFLLAGSEGQSVSHFCNGQERKKHTNINFLAARDFFLPMYQVHRFSVGCCKHAHIAQGAHDYVRDAFNVGA